MDPSATPLDDLGSIRVWGPDAVKFLQGQLSNDVTKLAATGSMLAGFHNPQGRVIALLRLVPLGTEEILAILPRELAAPVITRLSKYVLRAKLELQDESSQWRVTGIVAAQGQEPELTEGAIPVRVDRASSRWWLIAPADQPLAPPLPPLHREGWRALDIAAELPQVYAATSEEFVAQMLNLDALGAIAFDKGCYTGQEVIARAHYRGRVKRRMQRFQLTGARWQPGDAGQLPDGRPFKVVEAVALGDGHSDALVVAPESTGEHAAD